MNCAFAAQKCSSCKAGSRPSGRLLYAPTSIIGDAPLASDHPAYGKDKQAYDNKKRGMANETAIQSRLQKGLVRKTLASGAALGDGDLSISTPEGNLNIEAKHRGKSERWHLTRKEYEKGQRQSVDVYAVTSQDGQGKDQTMYVMDESTFIRLVGKSTEPHSQD